MTDTLVLCYHALSDRWPADLSVRPDAFEAQLELLHDRGYRGVTFTPAVQEPAPGKRVAVTFDDAFESVLTQAKPILDRLGWPATVFAVSGFAARGGRLRWQGIDQWEATEYAPELEGLGWDRLRGLADDGWEVGSHTVSHPYLTATDDARLATELRDSRTAITDALGRPCTSVAYPYGDCDRRVVAAAREAGYHAAAGLPTRWAELRPLDWPRAGIYRLDDLSRFRLKTSRGVRRLRRLAKR